MNLQSEGSKISLRSAIVPDISPVFPGGIPLETNAVSRFFFEPLDAVRQVSDSGVTPAISASEIDKLKKEIDELNSQLQRKSMEARYEMEQATSAVRTEAQLEYDLELDRRLTIERDVLRNVCEQFRDEREHYFSAVEAEVVKLSLAIAQRVLHREVMIDPVMLTAVARVALEKVKKDSGVVLRVPALDEPFWRQSLATASSELTIVADERMSAGDCVLETKVGRVELGVSAQLEEIERGFLDLLQRRPA